MTKSITQPVVVIPNLNGGDDLLRAVKSLLAQTMQPYIIVVDNASTDDSVYILQQAHPDIELIQHTVNKGYAGGVNPGLQRAIESGASYVAPFNDDAVADPQWLEQLTQFMDSHETYGAAACKVISADKQRLDSTGEYYTVWGLAYPRGRREYKLDAYDSQTDIFAASGAASLFRTTALKEIGLFDEDFFAYYEDVDLCFRMQLMGWGVGYVPSSIVYHKIGMTSSRVKGFTTLQTMKNLPLLWFKNVPARYLFAIGWRLFVSQTLFFARATSRGHLLSATKGVAQAARLIATGFDKRRNIQQRRKVNDDYMWDMIVHDLPPNAHALRHLRAKWWKLRGKA